MFMISRFFLCHRPLPKFGLPTQATGGGGGGGHTHGERGRESSNGVCFFVFGSSQREHPAGGSGV